MSTWKYIKDERPVTRNYPLNISTELSFDCFNHSVSQPCSHFHGVHASGQQPENEHCAQEGQNLCWLGNQDSIPFISIHGYPFISIGFHLQSSRLFWPSKFVQKNSQKKGLGDWACEGALWTVCSLSGCGWSRVIKNYLNKITARMDIQVMRSGFTAARCVRRASHGLSLLQQLILIWIVVWKMKQSDLSTKQVHQIWIKHEVHCSQAQRRRISQDYKPVQGWGLLWCSSQVSYTCWVPQKKLHQDAVPAFKEYGRWVHKPINPFQICLLSWLWRNLAKFILINFVILLWDLHVWNLMWHWDSKALLSVFEWETSRGAFQDLLLR